MTINLKTMKSPTTSRYIIYGLTDPASGAVRYIGRSFQGLLRPREHLRRAGRERTYKAAWIRALLAAGKQYGMRVLQECVNREETVGAEVYWIAEGRRLGWPLTNLTDGGEGAAVKRCLLPVPEIVERYAEGESELALARAFGVNRWTISNRLREAGVTRRNGSEANIVRLKQLTTDQRKALASAANEAIRTRPKQPPTCRGCGEFGHCRRWCPDRPQ